MPVVATASARLGPLLAAMIGFTGEWLWQVQAFEFPFSYLNTPHAICNDCGAVGPDGINKLQQPLL